jgi:hypothetical protein
MLFHFVPCTMSVSWSVMGLYPVHGHVISGCSVYNVCKLFCDGIIVLDIIPSRSSSQTLYMEQREITWPCTEYNPSQSSPQTLYTEQREITWPCTGYNPSQSSLQTLYTFVPFSMSVGLFVEGLYPVHGHVISRCSVYNVCELLCDGLYPVHEQRQITWLCSRYNPITEQLTDIVPGTTWNNMTMYWI